MRGHVHQLTVVGQRAVVAGTVPAGEVKVDEEGRWRPVDPNQPVEGTVSSVTVRGRIGYRRQVEIPEGSEVTTAAHLPRGTPVVVGDDLIADAGDPLLDGRYEIVEVQPGPALLRLLLRRSTVGA